MNGDREMCQKEHYSNLFLFEGSRREYLKGFQVEAILFHPCCSMKYKCCALSAIFALCLYLLAVVWCRSKNVVYVCSDLFAVLCKKVSEFT